MKPYRVLLLATLSMTAAHPAQAGPPFVTDDPEPVEFEHWEVNYALALGHRQGDTGGTLPNVDINYGPLPGVQVHVQPQAAYDHAGLGARYGVADTEAGLKLRLHDEGDTLPMVSLYPLVEIPTGDRKAGLGTGGTREFLPVWLQKSLGDWTSYGGIGRWLNHGANGLRDGWFSGWTLLYQFTPDLQLGGEVFTQTADPATGTASAGFNVGGSYAFTQDYHLLFSTGRGLANAPQTNQISGYLALQVIY